jgi:hypothetical protein
MFARRLLTARLTATLGVAVAVLAFAQTAAAQPVPSPSPSPAAPPPSAAPVASPSAAPSATPTPVPTATPALRELLLEGGYTIGKIYNNYANGLTGSGFSYVASGAYRLGSWAVELDDRNDQYTTIVNIPGPPGPGTGFLAPDGTYEVVPPFTGRINSLDGRIEHQAFTKNVYLGLSYIDTSTTYGYPSLKGLGVGVEQYANYVPFALDGFLFYYPNVSGTFVQGDPKSPNFGKSFGVNFAELKYSFETSIPISYDFYMYMGYGGYRMLQSGNSAQNVEGPFIGLGTRLFRAGAAADEPEVAKFIQTTPKFSGFLQGAFSFGGENTIGAASGPNSSGSYNVNGTYLTGPYAFDANVHTSSFTSTVPATTGTGTMQVTSRDTFVQENALVSVTPHLFYLGLGLMQKSASAGYTSQFGWGVGGAKLPDLIPRLAWYGSVFYYFAPATYTANGTSVSQDRRYLVYDYGVTYRAISRGYLYLGYWGYHGNPGNDPIDETHSGPYVGLGYRM